jgi:hypothetical protein
VARRAKVSLRNAQKLLNGLLRAGLVAKAGERGGWRWTGLRLFPGYPPAEADNGEKRREN